MNTERKKVENITRMLDQAVLWHRQGDYEKASNNYHKILKLYPHHASTLNLLGLIEYQRNNYQEAIRLIESAIRQDGKNPDFYNNLGTIQKTNGDMEDALSSYSKALALKPDHPNILYNIGGLYLEIGNIEAAISYYRKTIYHRKESYQAYTNLSALLNQTGKYKDALDFAVDGLKYAPNNSALLNNMGNALSGLEKWKEALEVFNTAIERAPENAEGYINLANTLQEMGHLHAAFENYQKALKKDKNNPKIYNDLGTVLKGLGRLSESAAAYQTAIKLNPNDAFPYHNMGNLYLSHAEYNSAIKCFRKAISLSPDLVEAYLSMGLALQDSGKRKDAIECFYKAISIAPEYSKSYCHLVRALQHECRWEELDKYCPILDRFTQSALDMGRKPDEVPFLNLSRHCDPSMNYRVAKAWSDQLSRQVEEYKQLPASKSIESRFRNTKITIGYISNNFKNHPTAHLIMGLFKLHDRNMFKVYCYSYGRNDGSIYRTQIENDCDRFVDIAALNNLEAANLIKHDKVDILVDLVGQMKSNRLEICALKPAVLQVRWLGMAGTSGGEFFDYIISDQIVTPENQQEYYSETFAYLPDTYQINNNTQVMKGQETRRSEHGLPENGFIYASFCSTYKIEPVIFRSWMKILKAVPESILWLLGPSCNAQERLRKSAEDDGIDGRRIVFADKRERSEHLERIRFADLCLDTRIVNGAATTSEALWCGVPVLTTKGKHFASRMASSILSAMELPELITETTESYEKSAIKLGIDKAYYECIKSKVLAKKQSAALFNTKKLVKNLENLFCQMWYCYGEGKKKAILKVS